ncbi:HpcH/HpaI aldolase/citrate lyase family protein [Neomegalonema perideroedes]|uniref:HpcH/HpaI aldolase/citrate lyase family protein n=1 Tax=Neomegalonema perideroedes TaxID=217219 RepID=UPI0005928951|nr:CoA ester lyase [Neomegalonema perideroedes]
MAQASLRPRRSVLYMPGSRERALEKARSLKADSLILDLEDAVAPSEKIVARELVAGAVKAGGFGGREILVRINGFDTEWGEEDLVSAAKAGPDAVLLPKVETPELVREVAAKLDQLGAPEKTKIWIMMETPLGALNIAAISASSPRLAGIVVGSNDLVKDLHAEHTPLREPIVTALGLTMLAARAYGLAVVDGVYNAFKDVEGFRDSCRQGRAFGFDGKTLIHPDQIATANEVFAPAEADLELARRQVAAYEEATARGEGVAVVDGRIVENLHVVTARRLLALGEEIARLESAA